MQRAYGLAYAGRHASAVKAAEALATTAPVTANALYNAAAVYGRCSGAVSKDAGLTHARQAELAESYASRAVALLALAHAAGPAKGREFVRRVNADKDLALLRSRPDFQKLLSKIVGEPEEEARDEMPQARLPKERADLLALLGRHLRRAGRLSAELARSARRDQQLVRRSQVLGRQVAALRRRPAPPAPHGLPARA